MSSLLRVHQELVRLYRLEEKARRIVHRHLRAVPAREMGLEAVQEETRLRSNGAAAEIEASVSAWQWGGAMPPISDEAQMWRYVRLHTALQWLSMGVGVPDWEKALGTPVMPEEEVVRWFLTHWWYLGGVGMRAMYEIGQ